MVLGSYRAIFVRVDHGILPREFHRPQERRAWDAQRGPNSDFEGKKAERLALAFRSISVCAFAEIESREFSHDLGARWFGFSLPGLVAR
jgi:hypothetical protein